MNRIQPSPAIAEALARGEIIKAIKLLRAQSGMDLRSAKLQVDAWLQAGAAQTVAEMLNRHAGTASPFVASAASAPDAGRLPPAALLALSQGQLLQAIKLTREQYPGMGLREAKELVEGYRDRNAPPAGMRPTVASGDRPGAWLWAALILLLVVAAAFWWLRS